MDIEQIKTLIELMVAHDLSRIELNEGESRILLKRGQSYVYAPAGMAATPALASSQTAHAVSAAGQPGAPPSAGDARAENELYIRSPMVGTFYAAPDPDSPSFVNVGAQVGPHTVVCIIEAMKVFNEIKAELSGRITRVLVKNAQAVEFDQPLFALAPA